MSKTLLRLLCYALYSFLAALVMIGIILVVFKANSSSVSCRLSEKEVYKILNESNDKNTKSQTIDFTGKFKLIKSENFDGFLEELGVSFLQRSIANRATSEYEIMKNKDVYTLKTISPFKTSEIKFKLNGELFEENRLDGVRVNSSMTQNGNKWIQKQFGDKDVRIIREFDKQNIRVTAIVNNIASVRIYKRIESFKDK